MSAGVFLKSRGHDVIVLEKESKTGGVIKTVKKDKFVYDLSTNSGLEKNLSLKELVKTLKIEHLVEYADRKSSKRYILRNDILHGIKGPISAISTSLISFRAKIRFLKDLFIPASSADDETLSSFVKRRFGRDILDFIVNPIVAGVFAGNPDKLSMKANYPVIFDAERKHGSVIKGMKALAKENKKKKKGKKHPKNMFSFKGGMYTIIEECHKYLNENIVTNAEVKSVVKKDNKYEVIYNHNGETIKVDSDNVISTSPSYCASEYFKEIDSTLYEKLNEIKYPKVIVFILAYNKADIKRELDSFGFLIPEKENKHFLGAIWSSTIFSNRSAESAALFTLYLGGDRKFIDDNSIADELNKARNEFKQIMNIDGFAILKEHRVIENAIPQYHMNYPEISNYIDLFERNNPGLHILGAARKGVGLIDNIQKGLDIANKLDN